MPVPVDGETRTSGRLSGLFDRCGYAMERRCAGHARSDLVSPLFGRVLELNAGSGENLAHYQWATHVVAAEPSQGLRERLQKNVSRCRVPVTVVDAATDHLPFPDSSFDAVVAILTLCSVKDQARALSEIRRVLALDGTLVFLEHVRSRNPWVAGAQHAVTPLVRHLAAGCRLNRDTVTAISAAGFAISILDTVRPRTWTPLMGTFVRGRAYVP
ncbi:class I SAM-dependent methyltransferase [Streptomyces sp. SPB162]|uniref:class I SAM-dependent methyltransferase n=1 Tax=Streptomyces sp. SPB162 TaxID=2940560 RepID=UPI002404D05C|nr:class I SAM-dependent methyltransferase [Streptomyces sp. SPB162]MDF9817176.1 ubiquinone/menaquinone biosynthesis C-methylase UbiE [Streptomyces sp. SPB162]